MVIESLVRLDENYYLDEYRSEVTVFCVVKNEFSKLNSWFEHYRGLGVKRFVIIDNGSSDGTLEYLLNRKDCLVYFSNESFALGKVNWLNNLLNRLGSGEWCLVVDSDELFVYPSCEHLDINSFVKTLDGRQYDAVQSFMLDMYSEKKVSETHYEKDKRLYEICSHFDGRYVWVKRAFNFGCKVILDEPIGGPRLRAFYPKWVFLGKYTPLVRKVFTLIRLGLLEFRAAFIAKKINCPPVLYKIPLFKWRLGNYYYMHHLQHVDRLAPARTALLHFKFFSDFHEKARVAVEGKQYYSGSVEYMRYLEKLRSNPNLTLLSSCSLKYESSEDLVKHGLISFGGDLKECFDSPDYGAN